MKSVSLDDAGTRASILGFGCSALMGRAGRKTSWTALSTAYDKGVTFFDTARSYGYGESELLLGEFLQHRRSSVILSTKFGILPARLNPAKRLLKPLARTIIDLVPQARAALKKQVAAQFSAGHFSVAELHESLEASLRALRTDHVDLLFLHEPTVNALYRDDLFVALEKLVTQGKVRRFGLATGPEVIKEAISAKVPGVTTVQFASNLFNLDTTSSFDFANSGLFAVANQPFGGPLRVAQGKALLLDIAHDLQTPEPLRQKLHVVDDRVLAEVVLNAITCDTGVKVVVPSMIRLDHLRANIMAIEQPRFDTEDLRFIKAAVNQSPRLTRNS